MNRIAVVLRPNDEVVHHHNHNRNVAAVADNSSRRRHDDSPPLAPAIMMTIRDDVAGAVDWQYSMIVIHNRSNFHADDYRVPFDDVLVPQSD